VADAVGFEPVSSLHIGPLWRYCSAIRWSADLVGIQNTASIETRWPLPFGQKGGGLAKRRHQWRKIHFSGRQKRPDDADHNALLSDIEKTAKELTRRIDRASIPAPPARVLAL